MYEDPEDMAGVMNNGFQSVLPRESNFKCQTPVELSDGVREIQVSAEVSCAVQQLDVMHDVMLVVWHQEF
ncbi:hypothetical protein E2C01_050844 [Portunus trituberculatus]|uniref:Uncharacterized protein n=1 Tax=Portunus trituberculatus TaxID=210409 RepID=A0A5B7GIM0_PORTR|nr:hypothetical protein [Portunus trituberculatus]